MGEASSALDASALLAYLLRESGSDMVAAAVEAGASISTVNLAEALSTLARRGVHPIELMADLTRGGLFGGAISVEPFSTADAIQAARLRPLTFEAGLSLGDRACIAQAARLNLPVLTSDPVWQDLALPVEVRPIRGQTE